MLSLFVCLYVCLFIVILVHLLVGIDGNSVMVAWRTFAVYSQLFAPRCAFVGVSNDLYVLLLSNVLGRSAGNPNGVTPCLGSCC